MEVDMVADIVADPDMMVDIYVNSILELPGRL